MRGEKQADKNSQRLTKIWVISCSSCIGSNPKIKPASTSWWWGQGQIKLDVFWFKIKHHVSWSTIRGHLLYWLLVSTKLLAHLVCSWPDTVSHCPSYNISQLSQYPDLHLHMPRELKWELKREQRKTDQEVKNTLHFSRQVNSRSPENKSKKFSRSTKIPLLLQERE